MKKIISALFLGLLLAGCSTTASTGDTTTPKNYDSTASQPQSSSGELTQDEIAQRQMQAFEANQVRMYTQPVNN
jgi:PBP1b-binding outer membrane lipoprotein LpoB